MAPERSPKRQKTSPDVETLPSQQSSGLGAENEGNAIPISKHPQPPSWYNSWSRKASPVTEIAHENSASTSTSSLERPRTLSPKARSLRSPSLAMTLGRRQTNRALPVDATTTVIHAEASSPSRKGSQNTDPFVEHVAAHEDGTAKNTIKDPQPAEKFARPELTTKQEDVAKDDSGETQHHSTWLGWLVKTDVQSTSSNKLQPSSLKHDVAAKGQAGSATDPQGTENITTSKASTDAVQAEDKSVRRSWLPWSSDAVAQPTATVAQKVSKQESQAAAEQPIAPSMRTDSRTGSSQAEQGTLKDAKAGSSMDAMSLPEPSQDGLKPAAWAFWSRERKMNSSSSSINAPHNGEIAISDTPSQGQPETTTISLENRSKEQGSQHTNEPGDRSAKGKALSKTTIAPTPIKVESANASAAAQEVGDKKQIAPPKSAKVYQNVLLPDLQSTLKLPEHPSIIQQLARLLHISKDPELRHLSLMRDPPKIRNALAIGVHGFFPAPVLRTVLGQPTGTSIKFADMAAKSIKRWTKARGYECEVKTAALEGEGKIAERVELLWKLLLNWIEEIRTADFVLVACHSQGVPVAIMLVSKLIEFGCLNAARVGICAMAGVNMGPFTDYKSRWISGSAGELFEFTDPSSKVSADYLAALQTTLRFGAHITFIGSIDDQLVSLESSIFSSVSHPHIYRAVSIDARVHAPNFLSHLVGFALKLRNLGIQDHGLIRELSAPLAGSLYTGEGHSRLYESDNCYDMAVDWSLLTTSMHDMPVQRQTSNPGISNPYILPFAMRGMLEEDFVKNELHSEASELLQQFDDWKPTTKALKDVKFRLEGIRSKL